MYCCSASAIFTGRDALWAEINDNNQDFIILSSVYFGQNLGLLSNLLSISSSIESPLNGKQWQQSWNITIPAAYKSVLALILPDCRYSGGA